MKVGMNINYDFICTYIKNETLLYLINFGRYFRGPGTDEPIAHGPEEIFPWAVYGPLAACCSGLLYSKLHALVSMVTS
jgi:hypothetical protein